MPIFKPSLMVGSISEIDAEALHQAGIKGIIINWTNTLVPKKPATAPNSVMKWLQELKSRYGIKVVIVSNSKPPAGGSELLHDIPALFEAGKPRKKAFMTALNILGTSKQETAVIGDGILTDLWGGNRLGMYTVFASPAWRKPRLIGAVKRLMVRALRM